MTRGDPPAEEQLTAGLDGWALDDASGPAKELSTDGADALVSRIVDGWAAEREGTGTPADAASGEPAEERRRAVGFAGWSAAAGLVVGFVLAGSMAAALVALTRSEAPATPNIPAAEQPPAARAASEEAPIPDADEEIEQQPEASTPSPMQGRAHSPVEQLGAANEARRRGRYVRAARLYTSLASQNGPEAYPAAVAAGSLYVEHLRRPQAALRSFRRALQLQSGGPLDLTIREGIASAHRLQGRTERERRALETIISRHPASNAASVARERLRALNGGE